MKSKFSSVVKVKKQALEKAENNLNLAKNRQRENEANLELAIRQCNAISLPQSGSVRALRENLQMQSVAREVKERAFEKVKLSEQEVNHYQALYKKAYLDFEKIQYLENEELKKMKKELEKLEAKALDEVAVSRFFYGAKNEE